MKIAFVTAMREEFRAVASLLDASATLRIGSCRGCSGSAAGHDIVIIEAGMGLENAALATRALLETIRPDILISAGFCGGIAPDLDVGTVVVATRLAKVTANGLKELSIEFAASGYNFVANQAVSSHRVYGGMFISTPVIESKSRILSMLQAGIHYPAVEMESSAVAQIATESGIPFVGIRSVSDSAGEEPGFSLDEFCDGRMRIRIHKVLLTVARKPYIIPQLVRLARNSRIAEAALARTIGEFLAFV